MGFFANQDLAESDGVGYCYGMVAYRFIMHALNSRRSHSEAVMAVNCEQLHTSVIRLKKYLDGLSFLLIKILVLFVVSVVLFETLCFAKVLQETSN